MGSAHISANTQGACFGRSAPAPSSGSSFAQVSGSTLASALPRGGGSSAPASSSRAARSTARLRGRTEGASSQQRTSPSRHRAGLSNVRISGDESLYEDHRGSRAGILEGWGPLTRVDHSGENGVAGAWQLCGGSLASSWRGDDRNGGPSQPVVALHNRQS